MKIAEKTKELSGFTEYLRCEEHSENTIGKYLHDVEQFLSWLDGRELTYVNRIRILLGAIYGIRQQS